jgi:hypothetical protein
MHRGRALIIKIYEFLIVLWFGRNRMTYVQYSKGVEPQ